MIPANQIAVSNSFLMHFANEAPINPRPAIMIFVTLECPSFPFSQDIFLVVG